MPIRHYDRSDLTAAFGLHGYLAENNHGRYSRADLSVLRALTPPDSLDKGFGGLDIPCGSASG